MPVWSEAGEGLAAGHAAPALLPPPLLFVDDAGAARWVRGAAAAAALAESVPIGGYRAARRSSFSAGRLAMTDRKMRPLPRSSIEVAAPGQVVNTKIWYRKESDLWARLGEKIRPEEGRFLQKDSAKELAVGSLLMFGRGTVCADFAGLCDDVARAEGTNGWISNRT
jgi:hypothetical protein